MTSVVPFTKASACGNDFLILDGRLAPADLAAFTRRICDRHSGVGADGVEWLFQTQGAEVQARLFNADGSEAEATGAAACGSAAVDSAGAPAGLLWSCAISLSGMTSASMTFN